MNIMQDQLSFREKKKKKKKIHVRHSMLNIPVMVGEEGAEVLEMAEQEGRKPKSVCRAIARSGFVVFGFIFCGWCFFGYKYGWTFIDCCYFAMVTVTTVGYGDLTPDSKPEDETFVWIFAHTPTHPHTTHDTSQKVLSRRVRVRRHRF